MPEYVFDHIHLSSPDPVKTAAFYEEMFGAKRISASENGAKLDLKGVTILINKTREGGTPGLVHFGIRTDNLERSVASLKESGVKFTTEPREIRPDFKISFLEAPEKVSIELQQGQL